MQKFPERLRQLRQERGISASTLSALCGLSSGMVHKYEHGKRTPTIAVVEILADHFGVSVDYLLGRSEKKSK